MIGQLEGLWKDDSFPARRSFDLVLAITLKNNGVKQFYTRNTKDFEDFNYFALMNPLN